MNKVPETTYELFIQGVRSGIELQNDDGSFPAGQAGPYDYSLTPVRKTGSWLALLTDAYKITGDNEFATAAHRAIDYLLSEGKRPHGYTFHAREVENKNDCDDLVGQAAPIEGLSYAASVFDRSDALETAEEVFLIHSFDETIGLWERTEVDGTNLSFDRTLNHQIIFATGAIYLAKHSNHVCEILQEFLNKLPNNVDFYGNGAPKHYVRPPIHKILKSAINHPNLVWNEIAIQFRSRSKSFYHKSIGYSLVVLLKLSYLKKEYPDHIIWESDVVNMMISFIGTDMYEDVLQNKRDYGSQFPWIDHAVTIFYLTEKNIDVKWVRKFIDKIDLQSGLVKKDIYDRTFQSTQIRKLLLLPNMKI